MGFVLVGVEALAFYDGRCAVDDEFDAPDCFVVGVVNEDVGNDGEGQAGAGFDGLDGWRGKHCVCFGLGAHSCAD